MIRVSINNSGGELDSFEATDEAAAAFILAAKLGGGEWLLADGDTITVQEAGE